MYLFRKLPPGELKMEAGGMIPWVCCIFLFDYEVIAIRARIETHVGQGNPYQADRSFGSERYRDHEQQFFAIS